MQCVFFKANFLCSSFFFLRLVCLSLIPLLLLNATCAFHIALCLIEIKRLSSFLVMEIKRRKEIEKGDEKKGSCSYFLLD